MPKIKCLVIDCKYNDDYRCCMDGEVVIEKNSECVSYTSVCE